MMYLVFYSGMALAEGVQTLALLHVVLLVVPEVLHPCSNCSVGPLPKCVARQLGMAWHGALPDVTIYDNLTLSTCGMASEWYVLLL